MHYFRFINNELYCEEIAVNKIAEKMDTPFYLYSQKTILENYNRFDSAFQDVDPLICYALKANSNVKLLSFLAQCGAGADVVSGGELFIALKSGFPPEKIVYAGIGKRDDEIIYALEQNILTLNVESFEELQVVNAIANSRQRVAPVAIRLNPDIDIKGHPYISTGKAVDKFGIDIETAKQIFKKINDFPNIKLTGLHCHIGSQITHIEPYRQVVKFLKRIVQNVKALGHEIKYVDIGGGMGVRYKNVFQDNLKTEDSDPEDVLSVENFAKNLLIDLRDMGCKIIIEPGRALVAEAGILVTKVLYRKESKGKQFVVVDAGMNDLIRPSHYGAYHEIVPVTKSADKMQQVVDVVGPICETGDFLARDRMLPVGRRGELLAVMTVGAYGFTLSSNYNARPKPAEVLVNGSHFSTIREIEKIENLLSTE